MTFDIAQKLAGTLIYLVVLILIGVAASRRMRDLRDFVVAGKRLRFFAVAFSARATGESAWLLLGLTGMGATLGVRAFWVVLGEMLGVAGAWLLLARRFKRLTDRYDSITMPDYLESRFRDSTHALRLVSAWALVIFVTIYVSAQIDATGVAFERFLSWDYFLGAALGFLIVVLYTISGGFLAVVWSDVFQGAMMVAGLVVLPVCGLVACGGWGALMAGLEAESSTLVSWGGTAGWGATGIAATASLACIGIGFWGSPQIFARFLALRSEKELAPGTAVALVWTLLADSGAVIIGMLARHLLGAGGEDALPALVEHLMPTVLVGLYIAIVLSATMSTADSLLVVATGSIVRDWYQRVRHPELPDQALVTGSRWATLGLALAALTVAFGVALLVPGRTVFWFVVFGWSGIAATFCPTVILSLYWPGFTRNGALAAMICGFLAVPLFKFGAPHLPEVGSVFAELGELVPAFVLSGVAGVVVSRSDRRGRAALAGVAEELREAGD